MRKIFLFILAVAIVCKGLHAVEPRITGGSNIGIEQAPWQVHLLINGEFLCGGSIIAPNMILTASHCLYVDGNRNQLYSASAVRVVAGVTCRSQANNINTFGVLRIILHPDPLVDAAILVLSRPIAFDNYRQPVNFLASSTGLFSNVGNTVRASGWGVTEPDNEFSYVNCLQAVNLRIISNQDATRLLRNFPDWERAWGRDLRAHEMAAIGIFGNLRQGTCNRDSGGPVTAHNIPTEPVLVGIASRAISGCVGNNEDSPSVFVRVSSIRNWIISHIVPNMAVSGPNLFCANVPATYRVSNVPRGALVEWTVSSGLGISGSRFGNIVQVRSLNSCETSLNQWVRATISHGNNVLATRQMSVTTWVSGQQRAEVNNATLIGHSFLGEFLATLNGQMMFGYDFRWSTNARGVEFLWQELPMTHLQNPWGAPLCNRYYVAVSFIDMCGGWSMLWREFDVFDGCFWFFAYPNPARDVLTVRLNDEQMEMHTSGQRASLGNVELKLYNHEGQLVRRQAMGVVARQATINTSGLPAGNYVLNIVADGQVVERQVIIVKP